MSNMKLAIAGVLALSVSAWGQGAKPKYTRQQDVKIERLG